MKENTEAVPESQKPLPVVVCHSLICSKCNYRALTDDGDSEEAREWFSRIGWTMQHGKIVCPVCAK